MLLAILTLHALVAAAAVPMARRMGRGVLAVCALPPAAALAFAAARAPQVLAGSAVVEEVSWAPSLGMDLTLRLDAFALLMVVLVSGVGVAVFAYAQQYLGSHRVGSFAATLLSFSGAMLGLVLADNALLLFGFWELTSVTSYLLIGTEDRDPAARSAALHAFLTTSLGGLALLGGLVLLSQEAGSTTISGILAAAPQGAAAEAGLALVLLGAFTKSAQVPFHTWLPGAMAAPTPVSAYLHSATMVKAGVYLIARFAPAFAAGSTLWRPAVLTVGLTTMLVGGYRALRQHDLKLLLAHGTVSQLGFLVVLLGAGFAEATFAGCALLLAHGMFKAALFLGVGVVDHQAHTRDLRRLSGLGRALPVVFTVMALAAASMAGLPPLLGFVAKEAAYEAFLHGALPAAPVVLAGLVLGSVLTAAYSARLIHGAFVARRSGADVVDAATVPRPPAALLAPAAVLAVLSLGAGLAPGLLDGLVNGAARALEAPWEGEKLALWHGVNAALGLSVLTVACGAALFATRERVERLQAAVPRLPSGTQIFDRTLSGVLAVSYRVTGIVQNGSLPTYLSVISLTLVAVPAAALLRMDPGPLQPVAANPVQVVLAVAVMVAAVTATLIGRRFAAVLLLGAVGYGVAALFVLHGAPDLALTQFLVETLSVVVFVLVLRHLPDRFARPRLPEARIVRVVVAVAMGVFVAVFALLAVEARTAQPAGEEYLARAYPEAEGRNVVNTILVDFRALDTLGEIVVLAVAAVGSGLLVDATRRRRADRPATAPRGESDRIEELTP